MCIATTTPGGSSPSYTVSAALALRSAGFYPTFMYLALHHTKGRVESVCVPVRALSDRRSCPVSAALDNFALAPSAPDTAPAFVIDGSQS